jgi:RHS repeat-associated protein
MIWKAKWIAALIIVLLSTPLSAQTIRYIHTDALGSVVAITDEHRNVIERREYEPYGAQLTPTVQDGPGYTGHVQDAATGLTYMQQRYYDPLGRFLSVDPVTADGSGNMRHFNRYAYAYNNPYKFTDPDGRQALGAPRDFYNPVTEEQARQILPVVADFTPGVGDVKGFVDAYNDPSAANIAAAVVGLAGPIGDGAAKLIKGADNIADGVRLNKQLGSEQQLGEVMSGNGEVIAGGANGKELRDAPRLSAVHGGEASDWTKVTSSSHTAPDGQKFSTHAYQNQTTGQVVEPKTKLIEENR